MNLTKSIRQIMFACGTAAFAAGTLAAVGLQNPPPGPGQIPDYFGVTGNYANSPEPVLATVAITGTGTGAIAAATTYDYNSVNPGAYTGGITDVQILNGGTGYLNGGTGYDNATTTVTVIGGLGVTPVTGLTAEVYKGVIVGIKEFNPFVRDLTSTGTGINTATANPSYIGNLATPVTFLGSGFTVPVTGTGLKKFVDLLPGIPGVSSYASTAAGYTAGVTPLGQALPVAVPDTTKFPGSDYYEIAETAYTQKMHSGLPTTHLRGYKQLNAPAGSASLNNQYLGPIIVAHKNRPVRVKLVNQLPLKGTAGLGDQLPFPVDHTYMGAAGATDTDNRTALHMHGGNTPWISDGTPREWIKPAGEVGANKGVSATNVPDMYFTSAGVVVPACSSTVTASCSLPAGQPQAKLPAGATTNPGDGALTFFFTNEQSARLMFYHDHAEGLTRLNVYDGLAAGFLLQDPTEQAMVSGGTPAVAALAMGYSPADQATYDNVTVYPAVLPPLVDTIPLVIQEKTFVPDNTNPVLNFYGPFASQLNSSDPTWRWGSGVVATGANGTGDLWVPHVYMPNQNPGDISGANSFGRWDYGPWFWPPFTGITHGAVVNPYYDATCVSSAANYCEGQYIPGVPNGNTYGTPTGLPLPGGYDPTLLTLGQPTGTPESFNDTPLVNGTAYPVLKVDPKQYRLRILSVGNDRMLNLSMVVAASNLTPNTALQNAAPAVNTTVMCDGSLTSPADRSVCTEARMVPFNATQHAVSKFPDWWYSPQKGGVTFDGRPSGVFDPATRGPAMVQIGTDGGFLSTPVVINNQPVNFEYNLKNIVVTNVKEHALLLGPAERADVVVDFSNFAGSTLLMYNDAPAPMPAFDLRLDYFTGDYDNTDTGGAFSTLPGYGPNTRTLMQIQVSGSDGSHPVDDTGSIGIKVSPIDGSVSGPLVTAVQTAFRTSQEPIIVPQAAYNAVYNSAVNDSTLASNANHNLALIQDYSLNFTPYASPATGGAVTAPVLMDMQPKTIIEDWTMDYGRMNALLGVELPKTTATTNTALPLGYIDPPTELVKISPNDGSAVGANALTDGTTLWRITHNGVDSHAMHFHLFHVQIVNRVGWDGTIRPTEPNELGWKDTVRMNPLEDVVVALRPKVMTTLPFKVPNSHHLLDPAQATGAGNGFFNLNPTTGNASTVNNVNVNYGWEYIWHCHILGHEENDMMRTIAVAQTPEAPTAVTATGATAVTVNWTDKSIISNWVTIQRALDSGFNTGLTTFNVQEPECTVQTGCTRNYVDNSAGAVQNSVYYRVMANNTVGAGDVNLALPANLASLTPGLAGYDNVTSESAFSSGVTGVGSRILMLSPSAFAFGNVQVTSALVPSSSAQVVTVTNTSAGTKTFIAPTFCTQATGALATCTTTGAPANYSQTNNCGSSVAAGANCAITVKLTPTTTGAKTAYMRVANFGTLGTGTAVYGAVALTATGTNPAATVAPTPLAFGNVQVGSTSTKTVTLTNTGVGPFTVATPAFAGAAAANYSQSNTCVSPVAVGATCTISVKLAPPAVATTEAATMTIANATTVNLTGAGVAQVATVAPTPLAFGNVPVNTTSTKTVTLTNTGAGPFTVATPAFAGAASANYSQTNNCVSPLAVGSTCTISVRLAPTAIAATEVATMAIANATTVTFSGASIAPTDSVSAITAFATTTRGTSSAAQTVTVTNTGAGPLNMAATAATLTGTGTNATQWTVASNTCNGAILAAGATCTIGVQFTPTTALAIGAHNATLNVLSNATAKTVTLTGTSK